MNEIRSRFNAPWDLLLIVITILVLSLLISISFYTQSLAPVILNSLIILFAASFGVYGYRIEGSSLKIIRLGWSKEIQLFDIKEIDFKPQAMRGSIRTWGIGGLFDYIGYFRNRTLSSYKAYATHRKKTVVITTNRNEQIVVTPDSPEEFVQSMRVAILNSSKE